MLDPIEEPLDMVAQLVGPFVEGGLDGAMVDHSESVSSEQRSCPISPPSVETVNHYSRRLGIQFMSL